ncbi:hypothetical protein ACNKHK_12430 [Shigella flexneri]
MVEIAKALARNAKIIAFDEPTSSLSAREIENLFRVIRELRNEGRIICTCRTVWRRFLLSAMPSLCLRWSLRQNVHGYAAGRSRRAGAGDGRARPRDIYGWKSRPMAKSVCGCMK